MTEKFLKIETAKRTDIYSFRLRVWRLMLDGDPFEPLDTYNGETEKDRRSRRNEALAALKHEDKLTDHVCDSSKRSGILSEQQLATVLRVIRSTLSKDPAQRELDLARLIRLLSPDFWYKSRQTVEPERISFDTDLQLLDVEKYFHELRKSDGVVKEYITRSFHDYAKGLAGDRIQNGGAAYQLAVCYAIGFGVPFKPVESIKWLEIAAMGGSQPAREALPRFIEVFDKDLRDHVVPPLDEYLGSLSFTKPTSGNSSEPSTGVDTHVDNLKVEFRGGKLFANGRLSDGKILLLKAAESCQDAAIGRFSNFFQKKYSKRDQPYGQAANPFGQYIGLSGLSLIPHFCLLFSSILLTTSHLFIMNFTNEGRLIIMTLIMILISS